MEDEAVVVAFRRHTLLPLDDCLYVLQATIPPLTRSSLHRGLQRHGIFRLPEIETAAPGKRKFKTYPSAISTSILPRSKQLRVDSTCWLPSTGSSSLPS